MKKLVETERQIEIREKLEFYENELQKLYTKQIGLEKLIEKHGCVKGFIYNDLKKPNETCNFCEVNEKCQKNKYLKEYRVTLGYINDLKDSLQIGYKLYFRKREN